MKRLLNKGHLYQKLFLSLLIALFALLAASCQNNEIFTDNNSKTQGSTNQNESSELLIDNREVLKLEDYSNRQVYFNFEEGNLPETKSINLSHTVLSERSKSFYNNEEDLYVLVKYIKNTLNVEINSNWRVIVNYYDADKTVGIVQFLYTVGGIDTNRSIVFNIESGRYSMMYYKCLTGDIDEADLSDRINEFKSKYIQERLELKDGETFYEEQTAFIYYIHSHTLVYTYTYYFEYGNGVINSDWGTERIIDKNGYAVPIYTNSAKTELA